MKNTVGYGRWSVASLALAAVALAAAVVLLASGAASAGADTAKAEPDTTPPEVFIRARKRQEFADALHGRGVQATCGTDERPVECTMVVFRGQKSLDRDTQEIVRPYNRARFYLKARGHKRRRILDHGPPIELRLEIKVVDDAGNKSRDSKDIRLVRDT